MASRSTDLISKTKQFCTSLTNSRGSRVAGPKSRSRVQSRGRGSNVAVAGPKSRSRVQSRGRGSNVAAGENDLGFEVTAE